VLPPRRPSRRATPTGLTTWPTGLPPRRGTQSCASAPGGQLAGHWCGPTSSRLPSRRSQRSPRRRRRPSPYSRGSRSRSRPLWPTSPETLARGGKSQGNCTFSSRPPGGQSRPSNGTRTRCACGLRSPPASATTGQAPSGAWPRSPRRHRPRTCCTGQARPRGCSTSRTWQWTCCRGRGQRSAASRATETVRSPAGLREMERRAGAADHSPRSDGCTSTLGGGTTRCRSRPRLKPPRRTSSARRLA